MAASVQEERGSSCEGVRDIPLRPGEQARMSSKNKGHLGTRGPCKRRPGDRLSSDQPRGTEAWQSQRPATRHRSLLPNKRKEKPATSDSKRVMFLRKATAKGKTSVGHILGF